MQPGEPLMVPDTAEILTAQPRPRGLRGILGSVWTRFLFRWAAFFGFIVGASNCPFCGRPACPQGIATAGVASGVLVALMNRRQRSGARKNAANEPENSES